MPKTKFEHELDRLGRIDKAAKTGMYTLHCNDKEEARKAMQIFIQKMKNQ